MSLPRVKVPLRLDRERTLVISFNALCLAEEVTGINFLMGEFTFSSVRVMRALVWAGLIHEDLGLQTVTVTAGVGGTLLRAYQDRWQWKAGIVVKDWRYAVRICNIDVSDLVALDTGSAALQKFMSKAMYLVPSLSIGKPAFYMNRETAWCLDYQRRTDVQTGGGLTYDNVDGKRVMRFRGIPIRIVDQLVTETTAIS